MNKDAANQNIFFLVRSLWIYLSKIRKRQIKFLTIFVFLSSFAEFLSIYSLVPFLTVLTNPEAIYRNQLVKKFSNTFFIDIGDNLILYLTIIFLVANLSAGFFRLLFNFYTYKISALAGADLSSLAYKYTINKPYSYHLNSNSNKSIGTVAKDINEIIYYVIIPTFQLIASVTIAIIIIFTLFIVSFNITINSLIIISLFYFLFVKLTTTKILKLSKINLKLNQNLIKLVQESIGGIRDIILSSNQSYFIKNFSTKELILRKSEAYCSFLSIVPKLIIEPIAIVLIACFGFYIVSFGNSREVIPTLGALTFSGLRLLPFAQRIYEGITLPKIAKSRVVSLLSILNNSLYENKEVNGKIKKFDFKQKIQLKNITFKYEKDTSPVLDDINFTINKGERIGIIGATGSGKSTIIDLIMCLIAPVKGSVWVDDKNLFKGKYKNVNFVRSWQSAFMHVPQNIFLADASIAENIAFGLSKDKIDSKKLKEAVKKAHLYDFVSKTKGGFNTIVGEKGIRLSGGQRQRIGIARALYKNSKIIFLDEATSALDEVTEEKIMNEFNQLGSDVTIIIITHRINTLRYCDKIYEIDSGKITKKSFLNGKIR